MPVDVPYSLFAALFIFVLSVVKVLATSGSRGSARVNLLLFVGKRTAWEQEEMLLGSPRSYSMLETPLILGITMHCNVDCSGPAAVLFILNRGAAVSKE